MRVAIRRGRRHWRREELTTIAQVRETVLDQRRVAILSDDDNHMVITRVTITDRAGRKRLAYRVLRNGEVDTWIGSARVAAEIESVFFAPEPEPEPTPEPEPEPEPEPTPEPAA